MPFGLPGGWEWLIILVIGLLIFGRRLPEVGRSLGRSIVEFKKGIKGVEDEVEQHASAPPPRPQVEDGARPALSTPAARLDDDAARRVSTSPRPDIAP